MKNRRNNVGIGILSIALALALPLNANATDTTKLIEQDAVITEGSAVDPTHEAPVSPATPAIQTAPTNTTRQLDKNTNYISQRDKEAEDKIQVKVYPVELKSEVKGVGNTAQLSYEFAIKGSDLSEEYTISVFALRDSKVKNFELDNFISEDKVTIAGEEMTKNAEKIAGEDIFGFRIKTKFTYKASVKAVVTIGDDDEAGDYSLYYMITTKDKTAIGKMDANLEKVGDYNFVKTNEQIKRDYDLSEDDKVNPFENLPFTKYLLNDTDEEKNLTDFMDLIAVKFGSYNLVASYINPNSDELKTDVIDNPKEYTIPANSLVRFDVRTKDDTTNLIKDSEIAAYDLEISEGKAPISLMSLMANKPVGKSRSAVVSPEMAKLIEEEKASLRKLYPKMDPKTLDAKSLAQAISKQKNKLNELMDGQFKPIQPMAEFQNQLNPSGQMARSVVELNPYMDAEDIEVRNLAKAIRDVTADIHELIQQALLDYELDKLSELEKLHPDQANEEYKNIARLVKEAEDVSKKANNKLIQLDDIILTDNQTDPLLVQKKGAKPVLNLGMLTPLTKINNLTKDSPLESERDFSTNLEKKLQKAVEKVKKVETVTIGEKENKKLDTAKEDKDKDPNKKPIVVDPKKKAESKETNEEKAKEEKAKTQPRINTPIFVKYLQNLKSRGKLLDNK